MQLQFTAPPTSLFLSLLLLPMFLSLLTVEFTPSTPRSDVTDRRIHSYSSPTIYSDGTYLSHDPDVQIITSDGLRLPAHSTVLAAASPVLENVIDRPLKHRSSERIIPILGVPYDAIVSFLRFLYKSRFAEEDLEKYGFHLLALSHVYLVPQLKQRCIRDLAQRLTTENVVDVLQLSKLCDAPDLHLNCMKLISSHFKAVEKTEGWKFLQNHDPGLELEILQFIDEAESRKKKSKKLREECRLYLELNEAMESLEHIFTEGCTSVWPFDAKPKKPEPCSRFSTCHGLQLLIKHFAECKKRASRNCLRCKRMGQLLRLHSAICDQSDCCRVPLCSQFKSKTEKKGKDEELWKQLARKVVSAKAISTLSLAKRKRENVAIDVQGRIPVAVR